MVVVRQAGTGGIAGSRGSFRFTWRGAAVANALDDAMQTAMEETAVEARTMAQGIVHVITGTLRASIFADVDARGASGRRTLVLGAHAPYAIFEELGTSSRPGHPYLRPVMDRIAPKLTERLRAAVRSVR